MEIVRARQVGVWVDNDHPDNVSAWLMYGLVVHDLPNFRSYLVKDGKLFLALMADGGIYEFVP